LLIGYAGSSLGHQDLRGAPANSVVRIQSLYGIDQLDKLVSNFYVLIIHEM